MTTRKTRPGTVMRKKDRYKYVLECFQEEMPAVTTELEFGSVFQLLVAVILSAQCTDKRVNMVTPALFGRYPDAKAMAAAEPEEVYEYVRSVSYPNSKARHLVEMSRMLVGDYGGEVPQAISLNLMLDDQVSFGEIPSCPLYSLYNAMLTKDAVISVPRLTLTGEDSHVTFSGMLTLGGSERRLEP